MEMERRAIDLLDLHVERRAGNEDGAAPVIEGHAAVFNQWSEELGGIFPFRERVLPGAFAESIAYDDIRALFNHDPSRVLGRNRAKTLELKETQKGLLVRIFPPDSQWARDLLVSIERGDITQMSFGFRVLNDKWTQDGDLAYRDLIKLKLFDVSPVTFPAYPETDVAVRAAKEWYARLDENRKHDEKLRRMALERKRLDFM